jgi:hypothetical protein
VECVWAKQSSFDCISIDTTARCLQRLLHNTAAQAVRLVLWSAAAFVPCAQGVGCGGGEHPEDALPFIHSARVGQKAREDMQKMLLHFAELPSVQASGFACENNFCLANMCAAASGSSMHVSSFR